MLNNLSFDYLNQLKKQSSALRLLRADHFPLLASFFYLAFNQKNRRAVPYQELIFYKSKKYLITHNSQPIYCLIKGCRPMNTQTDYDEVDQLTGNPVIIWI